jgi:hypothetical protein
MTPPDAFFQVLGAHLLVTEPAHPHCRLWATQLGQMGAKLMLGGCDADTLQALTEDFQAQGVDTRWALASGANPAQHLDQWLAQVAQRMGELHGWVSPQGVCWYPAGLPKAES